MVSSPAVPPQISRLRINDTGTYQCLVNTEQGADYKEVHLSVTGDCPLMRLCIFRQWDSDVLTSQRGRSFLGSSTQCESKTKTRVTQFSKASVAVLEFCSSGSHLAPLSSTRSYLILPQPLIEQWPNTFRRTHRGARCCWSAGRRGTLRLLLSGWMPAGKESNRTPPSTSRTISFVMSPVKYGSSHQTQTTTPAASPTSQPHFTSQVNLSTPQTCST